MAADNVTSFQQVEDQLRRGYADAAAVYRGNIEALLASGQAMANGFQAAGAATLAFCQSQLKHGLETGQRLAECDSPQSAIEVQLDFAKATLQAYVDQCRRLGELTSKVIEDCLAPVGRRSAADTDNLPGELAA